MTYEYAHEYTDMGGSPSLMPVTEAVALTHKPSGHRSDGSPYWNYRSLRRPVGQWASFDPTASPKPAELGDEEREFHKKHGIEPGRVIDAQVERTWTYMWRSPLGTYEARAPHDLSHVMVGSRVSTKATIEIIGTHPRGQQMPTADPTQQRSLVVIEDAGTWQFTGDEVSKPGER